jgi:hypothetical protein
MKFSNASCVLFRRPFCQDGLLSVLARNGVRYPNCSRGMSQTIARLLRMMVFKSARSVSSLAFFRALRSAGVSADKIPESIGSGSSAFFVSKSSYFFRSASSEALEYGLRWYLGLTCLSACQTRDRRISLRPPRLMPLLFPAFLFCSLWPSSSDGGIQPASLAASHKACRDGEGGIPKGDCWNNSTRRRYDPLTDVRLRVVLFFDALMSARLASLLNLGKIVGRGLRRPVRPFKSKRAPRRVGAISVGHLR